MRRILRVAKFALVLTIVFMMTVDTANACRFAHWFAHRAACCAPAPVCQPVCQPVVVDECCGAPVVSEAFVVEGEWIPESHPIADGADWVPLEESEVVDASPVDVAPLDEVMEPTPGVPMEVPADAGGEELLESPAAGGAEAATDGDDATATGAGGADLVDEPAAVEATPADAGDDLFDTPDAAPADAGDDLFDTTDPGDAAPGDAGDDLFDTTDPADAAPADAGDDLFDTTDPGDAAPADAGDDFFDTTDPGDAAPADAGDDLFDTTDPADAAPADAGDDLFDTADPGDAAPADAGDDLFDTPDPGDATPADADDDDLFNTPDDEGDDNLFGGTPNAMDRQVTSTELNREPAPASIPVKDETNSVETAASESVDIDRLTTNRSRGMRVWTDNTGTYQTVGRLTVIAKSHIRLLKDNGRNSTVPLSRLSTHDLDYVMAVAKKLVGTQRIASR